MSRPMVLALDELGIRHLTHAINQHAHWCRQSGQRLPASLAQLAMTLAAQSGQEEPTAAPSRAPVDAGPRELLDYPSAARMLSVSDRTVRRMVADGRLRSVRVGRRVLVPAAEVARFAQEGT